MSISKERVIHVARLARLELDDAAIEAMTEDLSRILDYVDRIRVFDRAEADAPVVPEATPFREDIVVPGLTSDDALANAPKTSDAMFQVPPAIEERE